MKYTAIFYAFMGLLATIITGAVLPVIKAKLGEINYNRVLRWVVAGVNAAETVIKGSKRGKERKNRVLNNLAVLLNKHHIEITAEELDDLIEAAVAEMNRTATLAEGDE